MALGRGNIEIGVRATGLSDSIAREVRTAERNIRPLSVSLNDKGFRQPLGRITGDLGEFQNALDASVARTLAFGAAVGVINSMANAFKGMVTSAIEVQKALADVNVILNLTSTGLANFSTNLFQVAANTGQSFQTVSEAAVELARQGLGAEESLKRINDAMILTRLSGMDAAKSVASLTAAVNSFGDTAITTTEVVNKLASVDAAFAVSTDDLANALARAGASAQGAKVDMDQLLAAVTSVQQTTARGGAVIGNAFKSIFTRLQRGGVRDALEEIGVATMDAAGNIRGAMSVLQDYAGVYGTLSDSQRAYTDELIAGVFQINNLKALMKDLGSDYSIYTRALEQSAGATDEAERRNKSLQTTLSALVNEAAVNVKQLASALGGLVATPAIENLLSVFNNVAGALSKALDPEKGSKLIKGMFGAIGKFIAGPGLIIVGLAFVKLFKFITGQSVKAVQEVFKINTAAQKTAQIEGQITNILKNNKELYERISDESLTHEQREEIVLNTLQAQTLEYKQQAAMISKLGSSRSVGRAVKGVAAASPSRAEGFIPRYAGGYIPNFANGMEGAVEAERKAITAGEGGASPGAQTKVLNNFPIGGGRNETMVANTDEVIVPKFGGSSGSAIFNKDMIKKGGMPEGAIPVAKGWIPNFALKGAGATRAAQKEKSQAGKSSLLSDPEFSQFWNGSGLGTGTLEVNTQEATSGFGIIGGRGSPGLGKAGLKGPFANEALKSNFKKLAQGRMSINSREAEEFMKLFSKRKASFTNIPINTVSNEPITRKDGESMLTSPISTMIQPYMADAVEKVSTQIYSNYFPRDFDTAGYIAGVRSAVDKDKEIVSRSVEGGVLESALKLGTTESAKNIGADESATWDFEPAGTIPGYLKDNFFSGKKVIRADAKRTVNDEERGKVLKKATDEVFPAQLSAGILDSIGGKVLARAKKSFNRKKGKADGFIPSFAEEIKGELPLPNSPPPFTRVNNFKTIQNVSRDIEQLSTKKGLSKAKMPPRSSKGVKGKGKTQAGLEKTGQRADWEDKFSATVIPLFQRFNISEFSKMSAAITNAMLKDEAYANALLSGKMMQRADQSQIQGVRLTLAKIKKIKQARADYAKVPQKGAPGAIPDYITGKKSSTGKPSYGDWLKKTKKDSFRFNGKPVSLIGKEDRPLEAEKEKNRLSSSTVKGILGELYAAKGLKTKVNQENDYFDLASGHEVKTTATQPAIDILRKGVNKKLSEGASYYNNKVDQINLGELDVVLPRGTKLTKGYRAGGFIPNFANSLDEAISREREVLQAQGSSAQIYTDTDSRVAGPQNPAGLLVANTRDEPRRGSQGVERVMKQGADPRINGAADGFIPSFGRLGSAKKLIMGTKGADGARTGGAVGGLGKVVNMFENIGFKAFALEAALQTLNGVLGVFGMEIPTLADAFSSFTDNLQGINRPLVDTAETYTTSVDGQLKAMERATAGIDVLSTNTARFGEAVKKGNLEAAAKFMQEIFASMGEIEGIDPSQLQELLNNAGDAEGIAKTTQALKDLANRNKEVITFTSDFATALKEVSEAPEGEKREEALGGVDFKAMSRQLTKGLDSEQLAKVGEKLGAIDVESASLSDTLTALESEIGVLPPGFKAMADEMPELGKGLLKQLKITAKYNVVLDQLTKAWQRATHPIEPLTQKINLLSQAMVGKAKDMGDAFDTLQKVGQIESTSRKATAKAQGTVTAEVAIKADSFNQLQKSAQTSSQKIQQALTSFSGEIIKTAGDGGKGLSEGVERIVKSIADGTMTNEATAASLEEIIKTGDPKEIELATKTLNAIDAAKTQNTKDQQIIAANQKSQLQQEKNQAAAFRRNNQLSKSQLESLSTFTSDFKASDGTRKSTLEKITELTAVTKVIKDLGGDTSLLAEMTEANNQLSELENLKAAFGELTGTSFDASSLEGLQAELEQFVGNGSLKELDAQASKLFVALSKGVATAEKGGGGVKTEADLRDPVISDKSIDNLANKIGTSISEGLKDVGVSESTAEGLDPELQSGGIEEAAASLAALASVNKANAEKNEVITKMYQDAVLKSLGGIGQFAAGTDKLVVATANLEKAVAKLNSLPAGGAASGFIPNFSPDGNAVSKAIKTERALGGKPVVDYSKQIGTYVRDAKTQPNLSAVKRDHPEGLRQASRNSAITQGALTAQGYVPNFARLKSGAEVVYEGGKKLVSLLGGGSKAKAAVPRRALFEKNPLLINPKSRVNRHALSDLGGAPKNAADFAKGGPARNADFAEDSLSALTARAGKYTPTNIKAKPVKGMESATSATKTTGRAAGKTSRTPKEQAARDAKAKELTETRAKKGGVNAQKEKPRFSKVQKAALTGTALVLVTEGMGLLEDPPANPSEQQLMAMEAALKANGGPIPSLEQMGLTPEKLQSMNKAKPFGQMWTDLPRIASAAYFGGQYFDDSDSQQYPAFVDEADMTEAYDLLSKDSILAEIMSSNSQIPYPPVGGEGMAGSAATQSFKDAQAFMYSLLFDQFATMKDWLKSAPHNDHVWDTVTEWLDGAATGLMVASVVPGPHSPFTGAGSVAAELLSLGLSGYGRAKESNMDPIFGEASTQGDLAAAIQSIWPGIFQKESSNFGSSPEEMVAYPHLLEEEMKASRSLEKPTWAALQEAFETENLKFKPSVFPIKKGGETNAQVPADFVKRAGYNIAGRQMVDGLTADFDFNNLDTEKLGAMPGGPQFIVNNALAKNMGEAFEKTKTSGWTIPLEFSQSDQGGAEVGFRGFAVGTQSSRWTPEQLSNAKASLEQSISEYKLKKGKLDFEESRLSAGVAEDPDGEKLPTVQAGVRALGTQIESAEGARDMVRHYIREFDTLKNSTGEDFKKMPRFPDPHMPKEALTFKGVDMESLKNLTSFSELTATTISEPNSEGPMATLQGFFNSLFGGETIENARKVSNVLTETYPESLSSLVAMMDPEGAQEGYREAENALRNSAEWVKDFAPSDSMSKAVKTGAAERKSDLLGKESTFMGMGAGTGIKGAIAKAAKAGASVDAANRMGLSGMEGKFAQSMNTGPDLLTLMSGEDGIRGTADDMSEADALKLIEEASIDPDVNRGVYPSGMVAGLRVLAEKGQEKLLSEQVRDAVYINILSNQRLDKKREGQENESEIIKRIQAVQGKQADYDPYLTRVIQQKEKSLPSKRKMADKFANARGGNKRWTDQVDQTQGEIAALKKRRDLYNSGPEGTAHLFYADYGKFTEVNGRRLGPSLWEAPSNALDQYEALRKRLGLDRIPAEDRLDEIRKGEGGEDINAILALNMGEGGLSELQKSEAIGGYGLFAQMRNQSGNSEGLQFKERFKAYDPDTRLAFMEEFGARAETPEGGSSTLFEDVLNNTSGMKDALREQIMRLVGGDGQRPAFGFLIDQIFSTKGSDAEKNIILNAVKDMGIPLNDVAPINEKLKSSRVSLKMPMNKSLDVEALPSEDIKTAMDFLYDFQFKDWAERHKKELGGSGIGTDLSFLNQMVGQTSGADLMNYPSYLNYLDENGMRNLKDHMVGLLKQKDSVGNYSSWHKKYNSQANLKTLLKSPISYGATEINPDLPKVAKIDKNGKNQYLQFGEGATNAQLAAKQTMGATIGHGTNSAIEELIAPKGPPFKSLDKVSGREAALTKIWDVLKVESSNSDVLGYAPYGYTKKYKTGKPSGKPENIESLISIINFHKGGKDKPTEDQEQTPVNEGGNIPATSRGFVPNFAEIAARLEGDVSLIKDKKGTGLVTGESGSLIMTDPSQDLVEIPPSSSIDVSTIASMPAEVQEVMLKDLGISQGIINEILGLEKLRAGDLPNEIKEEVDPAALKDNTLIDLDIGDMFVKIKKLKRESSLNLDRPYGTTGIRGAAGFVPNFSAVAGEIAASRAAGYKSPVTPGQVKTMNIPGAGKAAYNTQESVFKMPGVVQPFIRPPKTSDAAPSYAKEVKKKHNFNPYQNAAGGFVPNFRGGAIDTVAFERAILSFEGSANTFGNSTNKFQTAVSKLNFSVFEKAGQTMAGASDAFAKQSTVLSEAASKIKDGAEKIAGANSSSTNFEPFTEASSALLGGFYSLEKALNKPLSLETATIEETMSGLITALKTIEGQITVDISPVTIDVQGAGGIELSGPTIKAITDNLMNIVENKIEEKVPGIIKDYMR